MCLKATPSRKVPQTPAPATNKREWNGEERVALLRVRTGPKGPESNRRELLFKRWDSKGERPAIRKTKGLRNSREEPAHPRWR